MNTIIFYTITIGTLSKIHFLKAENIPTVTLQKCSDFPESLDPTKFSLDNYPREDPEDDRPIHYTLSGSIDFEKSGTCPKIQMGRILSHSGSGLDVKVVLEHSELTTENQRYGSYITRDGRYFDGLFYLNLTDYCVKEFSYDPYTKTNLYTDIRICGTKALFEQERRGFCTVKCCAPNFIIDYATSNCRPLNPNEPGWTPKVCDYSDCRYENDFCRQRYGLNRFGSDKCKEAVVLPYSKKLKLEKGDSLQELMYKANNGKWNKYEYWFCMDGIVDYRNLTYKNTPEKQVVVVCKKDAELVTGFSSAYKLNVSSGLLISILVTYLIFKIA